MRERAPKLLLKWSMCCAPIMLCSMVVTYAPSGNSGFAHARRLAELIACATRRELVAPSNFAKRNLTDKRILIVDDVLKTGATLRRLALRLVPNLPQNVQAIVYLKAHEKGGKAIL